MEERDIKRAGLKITQPRVKILDLLSNSQEHHLSAEDIYKLLLGNGEEIGLATVYRVLTQFEAAGLVNRHHFEGGQAVFELATEEHHDHMVCMKTGRVVEFYDEIIEQRQQELARLHNFRIKDHSLILYGEFIGESDENA
ncbi:MAG TPA: ferric iron uptake transcriptional regulator [Candidatus Thiothrix moscowensis]|uniref:ferric iron uptake transcriptional regulator n=1 Tax=unclassified Thiothrix TaxID=2636184 RepID=UPI001A2EEF34|nr:MULTISPECIES: ferric iron uptake transcriptional regulator [unclassified Thiothrix]MBJ6609319.1 ferric iron uptake transcriptional regulator [Candidatus Thiothrix moscowensis]HRJ51716.1 ferric iron uptake transcriptional regulator [Candidatus Thiothrix moscowensis]HRJ92031.1 ferric iron uptake transcriptional regulator [Candidatus Thiothrix moscowensis]